MKNKGRIIREVVDSLPYTMRMKAEKRLKEYEASKREKLSPEVVERLYLQVIQEAKERGK